MTQAFRVVKGLYALLFARSEERLVQRDQMGQNLRAVTLLGDPTTVIRAGLPSALASHLGLQDARFDGQPTELKGREPEEG